MRKQAACAVLGFYTEPVAAERSYREMAASGMRRVSLFRPDGTLAGAHSTLERYRPLRLPGESLIAVQTESPTVEAATEILKWKSPPALFLLREPPIGASSPDAVADPVPAAYGPESMRDLALQHGRPAPPARRSNLLARLSRTELAIDTAYDYLMEAVRLGHAVTESAEWLLDNRYLAGSHASDVRRDLPRRYAHILPTLPSRHNNLRIGEI